MRRAIAPAVLVALGVLLTVLVTVPVGLVPGLGSGALPALITLAWVAFAAAIPLARRVAHRIAVPVIVAGAVAMPLAAALVPPTNGGDIYRYVWDARVQAAGIDPYQHPPAAAALVPLRDPMLWPADGPWCVAPGEISAGGAPLAPGCTLIDQPAQHTTNPPAAQAYFRVIRAISPAGSLARPFQLAGAVFAIATSLLLLKSCSARGADPRSIIAWAWCPAVALEAANNAHVDALAVLLAGSALVCLGHRGKDRWLVAGGVLLGLAIATRFTPVLVLPALIKRRPAIVALTVPLVLVALYAPYVADVGIAALSGLPGYPASGGAGTRFALIGLLVPPEWVGVAAAVLLVAAIAWVLRTTDPERPWLGAATLTGVAFLVATPGNPWHTLLLVVLVALGARTVWLTVVAAAYLAGFGPLVQVDSTLLQRLGFGIALAVVAGTAVATRHRGKGGGKAGPVEPAGGPSGSPDPAKS